MQYPNGLKTRPTITSGYGPRAGSSQGGFHYGTDFTGFRDVHSIAAGVVTFSGWMNDKAGNTIAVDIEKSEGRTVTIVYMHLASIAVRRGARVTEGQYLGRVGSTGNATGPCCHLEVRTWKDGKCTWADPVPWLAARVGIGVRKRKARANSNGRTKPSRAGAIRQVLKAGTVGTFDAYTHGETVQGNNVWYRGRYFRRWFWSGAFEGGANTTGLKRV